MNVPLEISYRNVQKNEVLDEFIRKQCATLGKVFYRISSCRIAVEKPQKHQRSGNPYRVRLAISVPPGHELVIRREVGEGEMHEALVSVVRKVFESARRRLNKHKEKQRAYITSPSHTMSMADY